VTLEDLRDRRRGPTDFAVPAAQAADAAAFWNLLSVSVPQLRPYIFRLGSQSCVFGRAFEASRSEAV